MSTANTYVGIGSISLPIPAFGVPMVGAATAVTFTTIRYRNSDGTHGTCSAASQVPAGAVTERRLGPAG